MTPRELWEMAVRLQHEAVCAIEDMPLGADEAAWTPVLEIVNRATEMLCDVAREAPRGTFTDEEWRAAYSLHRDALIAANRRNTTHAIAAQIERTRAECCDLVDRGLAAEARRHMFAQGKWVRL